VDTLRETVLGTDPYDDVLETDAFVTLLHAARNRALEYEPELPPQSALRISNPVLFGALVLLLVAAVAYVGRQLL
jgi:hypothetical protein